MISIQNELVKIAAARIIIKTGAAATAPSGGGMFGGGGGMGILMAMQMLPMIPQIFESLKGLIKPKATTGATGANNSFLPPSGPRYVPLTRSEMQDQGVGWYANRQ
jgi:hypothetical protein